MREAISNKFYIYEWYNIDTKEVFYVGKGKGNRYKVVKGRNSYFLNYHNKYSCAVRKVRQGMAEKEAYAYEIDLISYYKDINQCKCNIHEGGHGGVAGAKSNYETYRLKYMNTIIMRTAVDCAGENSNTIIPLSYEKEMALQLVMDEFDFVFADEYYGLKRDDKLLFCTMFEELMVEYDYNSYVQSLVDDGAYFSMDDFWEQQYKY